MEVKEFANSEDPNLEVCLNLPVRGLRIVLSIAVASLFAGHLLTQYLAHFSPLDSSFFRMLVSALDLNAESNVSTWYSSTTLFVCALLLAVIWLSERRRRALFASHWLGLSLITLVFSLDEIACLHEKLNDPLRALFGASGFFRFAWVIPGLAFLSILLISYRRFYHSLPRATRLRLGLAAAIYFVGCLGFEMLGGKWSEKYGRSGFGYGALTGAEELFEMVGVLVLIDCLALHIRQRVAWPARPAVPKSSQSHAA